MREFNGAVLRAEAGIKNLRLAARESGDDLEKLVEKSMLMRDELQFIVGSADQIANRLSQSAASAVRPPEKMTEARGENRSEPKPAPGAKPVEVVTSLAAKKPSVSIAAPSSRAERELMQALEKLG